ncbi:FAD-dependent oxidoreductase [Corynebacterium ulceribovis]|uniref:FAD-dependent oxidoreductase n=1 Tax=Corynebacterium ulceribovis TaxID=487732 RepID=UPI001FE21DEB|nr:FAD-dependent oxidoreductase [Corynebacterium ulceribovis]
MSAINTPDLPISVDVAVIGGGQSALACAYYLHRSGLSFVLFDDREAAGGAWQNSWSNLTLFSTHEFSNLPGMPMPKYDGFPPYTHVIDYLTEFERRFDVPVVRPAHVDRVTWQPGGKAEGEGGQDAGEQRAHFVLHIGGQRCRALAVISATGTRSRPFVPRYPGAFSGVQLHNEQYRGPEKYAGTRVAVVGGANSAAQVAADLVNVADVTWYTKEPPRWMPDEVDGRVLFQNFDKFRREQEGNPDTEPVDVPDRNPIGDIVMVPPVLAARDAGKLTATPMFHSLDEVAADYLIWCTGYRPESTHLRGVIKQKTPQHPGLYLVGYGNWCGLGSATLAGVGPSARSAVAAARDHIGEITKSRR